MKVLFPVHSEKGLYLRESVGLMRLVASLRHAGISVEACEFDKVQVTTMMDRFQPDIVAYSVLSGSWQYYYEGNCWLKERYKFTSIFGNAHPTYFPEALDLNGIDAICLGEGEQAIVDFAQRLGSGGEYWKTPNFYVKKDGEVFQNPVRPLVMDLDTLPMPDRDFFYERFWKWRANPVKVFFTTRGCPHNCSFCHNDTFKKMYRETGFKLRTRSVDNVLDEIEHVKNNHNLQLVRFLSDILYLNTKWLREFAEKYPKRIGLPYICMLTPKMITPESVELLNKSGIHSAAVGIDAGNEKIRREIMGRPFSDEVMHNAMKLLSQADIEILTYNIFGIPGGSIQDDLKLFDFNAPYKVSYAFASLLTPFPKTKIYDTVKEMGLMPEGGIDYEGTMLKKSPLDIPNVKQVQRLQKLFALLVAFPWIRRAIPLLINLPLDFLYWPIHKIYKAYCFKCKLIPHKPPLKLTLSMIKEWFFGLTGNEKNHWGTVQKPCIEQKSGKGE